jgi:hypothetical protein
MFVYPSASRFSPTGRNVVEHDVVRAAHVAVSPEDRNGGIVFGIDPAFNAGSHAEVLEPIGISITLRPSRPRIIHRRNADVLGILGGEPNCREFLGRWNLFLAGR